MNFRLQVIIAIIILVALGFIINMIRKKALELRYALAWLVVGIGVLILDIFPVLMTRLAAMLGIYSPMNMLIFPGIFVFHL